MQQKLKTKYRKRNNLLFKDICVLMVAGQGDGGWEQNKAQPAGWEQEQEDLEGLFKGVVHAPGPSAGPAGLKKTHVK